MTGAEGKFVLEGLDADLLFGLLVHAPGYVPTSTGNRCDPFAPAVEITLEHNDLESRDPARVLRGRVVDARGRPIAHALVDPLGRGIEGGKRFGGLEGIDALAISDAEGQYALGVQHPGETVIARVSAAGFAERMTDWLAAGSAEPHELVLDRGVTVTGTLEKNGEPLAGVAVGLVQKDHDGESFLGARSIGTDSAGRFTFVNVVAREELVVYGAMDSLRSHGALPLHALRTGAVETTLDVGALELEPGLRVSGFVVTADGAELPAATRVLLGREEAWDTQSVEVGEDGNFTFEGVPRELVTLSTRVRGYILSQRNESYDPLNHMSLLGRVDGDIEDLVLLLEPGELGASVNSSGSEAGKRYMRLLETPLRGAPPEGLEQR